MKVMKQQTDQQKNGKEKPITEPVRIKQPDRELERKFETHTNESIIPRYQYSGISCEAQIITDELLKASNFQPKTIAKALLKLSVTKLQTAVKILSNHNTLNYHMEKCGLATSPHCDYCTEVMKEIDGNWDIKCLETSYHILCKCKYFATQRASSYYDFVIDANKICTINMTTY